jgi:hypothetical protein
VATAQVPANRTPGKVYPYTLRALTEALEDARFRSFSGPPQVLAVISGSESRIIRRYEDGREVPARSSLALRDNERMIPAWAGENAYRRAMDSGLLYAEGYTCRPSGIHVNSAWCLDGEAVVDPGFSEPGTAYFGVALQSGYVRRFHDPQRSDDGSDMFRRSPQIPWAE